jgi:hypothetical protein
MQVAELLLTLSLPKAEMTNFFIAGQVKNQWHTAASALTINTSVV